MKNVTFLLLIFVIVSCGKSQPIKIDKKNAITISFLANNQIKDETHVNENESNYTQGTKLMSSEWGQLYPYNNLLLPTQGEIPPTGCVPTALAQIFNYYRPEYVYQNIFYHNTMAPNGVLRYQSYNWNEIDKKESSYGQFEIQKILRDIGFAMQVTYEIDGSSASLSNIRRFLTNFGFTDQFLKKSYNVPIIDGQFKFDFPEDMKDIIIDSIDNLQPIILSAGGRTTPYQEGQESVDFYGENSKEFNHALIIDGYRYNQKGELELHLNLGWSGRSNGFYSLKDGIKLHRKYTEEENLTYFNEYKIYYSLVKCENSIQCPRKNASRIETTYDESTGQVNSPSSANHLEREVVILEIDDEKPGIKNRSGFYEIDFINVNSGQVLSYDILKSAPNLTLNIGTDEDPFPKGRYLIRISSMRGINRDLTNLPIQMSIVDSEGKPFKSISAVTRLNNVSTRILLENKLLVIPTNKSHYEEIKITSINENLEYEFRLLENQDSSIKLEDNVIIIDKVANGKSLSTVKIGLFSNNQLIETKELIIVRAERSLKAANPEATFRGVLQRNKYDHHYFYAKGNCEISGNRGLSGQGFYYSLRSVNGDIEFSQSSENITISRLRTSLGNEEKRVFNLPEGFYILTTSPTHLINHFLVEDHKHYSISVKCDQESNLLQEDVLNFYGLNP